MPAKALRNKWVRVLARWLRGWADSVLEEEDAPGRDKLVRPPEPVSVPSLEPQAEESDWLATLDPGPPAHWVEKVRHAAPELLRRLPAQPRRQSVARPTLGLQQPERLEHAPAPALWTTPKSSAPPDVSPREVSKHSYPREVTREVSKGSYSPRVATPATVSAPTSVTVPPATVAAPVSATVSPATVSAPASATVPPATVPPATVSAPASAMAPMDSYATAPVREVATPGKPYAAVVSPAVSPVASKDSHGESPHVAPEAVIGRAANHDRKVDASPRAWAKDTPVAAPAPDPFPLLPPSSPRVISPAVVPPAVAPPAPAEAAAARPPPGSAHPTVMSLGEPLTSRPGRQPLHTGSARELFAPPDSALQRWPSLDGARSNPTLRPSATAHRAPAPRWVALPEQAADDPLITSWPELPDAPAIPPPHKLELHRDLERRGRLDREQRGE